MSPVIPDALPGPAAPVFRHVDLLGYVPTMVEAAALRDVDRDMTLVTFARAPDQVDWGRQKQTWRE